MSTRAPHRRSGSGERRTVIPLSTSRTSRYVLREQCRDLGERHLAAKQMREQAVGVPWRVRLDAAGKRLHQQPRRPAALDLVVDRLLPRAQTNPSGRPPRGRRPARSPSHICRRAARSAAHPRRPQPCAARTGSPPRPRAVAGLERAHRERREVALGVAQQRRSLAEHRAVEIRIDAAQGHAAEY